MKFSAPLFQAAQRAKARTLGPPWGPTVGPTVGPTTWEPPWSPQESRQRAEDYAERVRTGKAADWKMTSAQLLQHIQECNPGRVEAGDNEG
eukprot:Skav221453  [mRNA]  locus=scaffold1700:176729:177001:- [translate_table: standard]